MQTAHLLQRENSCLRQEIDEKKSRDCATKKYYRKQEQLHDPARRMDYITTPKKVRHLKRKSTSQPSSIPFSLRPLWE